MSASDQLKDIAREASYLYRPIWKVKDYAIGSQPIKQDFEITPMVSQLNNTGEFFIVQDAVSFEIDRMSLMSIIDEELDLSCMIGKMTNLLSAYSDMIDEDKDDPDFNKVDSNIKECDGFKEKYEWYGTGGSDYFTSLELAERYIAKKISKGMNGENDATLLDCAPFDIRDEYPELLIKG